MSAISGILHEALEEHEGARSKSKEGPKSRLQLIQAGKRRAARSSYAFIHVVLRTAVSRSCGQNLRAKVHFGALPTTARPEWLENNPITQTRVRRLVWHGVFPQSIPWYA